MARIKWVFQDDDYSLDMEDKIQLVKLVVDMDIKDLSGNSIGDQDVCLKNRDIFELWVDQDVSDQSCRIGAGLLFSHKFKR